MNLISRDSKVLIAGDSWGDGEKHSIRNDPVDDIHLGLEVYLKEYGCNVTNISIGGGSNRDTFNKLKSNLNQTYDVILVFQTDPYRDLRPYQLHVEQFKKEKEDFLLLYDELLDSAYERFNSLNVPIYILGGCSNVNLSLIKKYCNLYPIIPNIIDMLGDNSIPPKIWKSDWIKISDWNKSSNKKIFSESLLEFLYFDNMKLSKKWFYPDPWHPNREAHKKIFEYLMNFKLTD